MFFRYLVVLGLIGLSVVAIRAQDEPLIGGADMAFQTIYKIHQRELFANYNDRCAIRAADQCRSHWQNAMASIDCGKNYLKTHQGRCNKN